MPISPSIQVTHNGQTYRVGKDYAYVIKRGPSGRHYLSKITSPRKLKTLFKLADRSTQQQEND